MKQPKKFDLDVQALQCTLEALDVVREAFETRHVQEGLSKQEFARWLGKDPSYLSRVLNGRVSNINYKTLAEMFVALGYYPELTLTDCENVHFAPNSVRDYDWGNPRAVLSRSHTWQNFPDLRGEPRKVNCSEWGNGDMRQHHLWWLRHLPHVAGATGGIRHNWWAYIINPNRVR